MKRSHLLLIILFSFSFIFNFFSTHAIDFSHEDEIDFATINEFITAEETHRDPFRAISPEIAIAASVLAEGINLPFWKTTYTPQSRDPLYLLPHKNEPENINNLRCHLFFNQVRDMGLKAGDLLELKSINTDKVLSLAIGTESTEKDILRLLDLSEKITFQEHTAGMFVQGGRQLGDVTLSIQFPICFKIRHFWLSKAEQDEFKNILTKFKSNDSKDNKKELFQSCTGLGDTQLKAMYSLYHSTSFESLFGISCRIPTSRFITIRNETETPPVVFLNYETFQEYLINRLINTKNHFLMPDLGNNGHTGIGFHLSTKTSIFNGLATLWTDASFEHFLARERKKLISHKKTMTPADLGQKIIIEKPSDADALVLLNHFVNQYLLPSSFIVSVKPGAIFNGVIGISIPFKKYYNLSFGCDFFARQQEKISAMKDYNEYPANLRIQDAEISSAYQQKIFSHMSYTKSYKSSNLTGGLGFDITFMSRALGKKEWSIYTNLQLSF